jgi:hypothetical protein
MSIPSPDLQLLFTCLRVHFGAADSAALEHQIRDDADWTSLISAAQLHGVIPLLRECLSRLNPTLIPKNVISRLRREFQGCAANSLLYARELTCLQGRLEENGMRAIAMKGPALAARLYGKLTLRQCRDLDLLVPRDEVTETLELLQSLGYDRHASYAGTSAALRTDKHILLVHRNSATKVEAHWAISLPPLHVGLDFNSLWERREQVLVLGTPVTVPSAIDLLLMLCVHWASHCWASLKWGCDIALFLRCYSDIDWERLFEEARRSGCLRMLLLGMELARDVGGALPWAVEARVKADASIQSLARDARRRAYTTDGLLYEQRILTYIRSRERLIDKTRIGIAGLRNVLALRTRLRRMARSCWKFPSLESVER